MGMGLDRSFLSGKQMPCPMCGGNGRFVYDNKEGEGTYYCRGCGSGNGWMFLKRKFGLSGFQADKEVAKLIGDCKVIKPSEKKDPVQLLKRIASSSTAVGTNSSIGEYLKNRGVPLSDKLKQADLYYWEYGVKLGKFPTMVALVSDVNGKGVSYHLTYTHKGKKAGVSAPKKMMTPKGRLSGCAVRLHDFDDYICIAEGIETALAVHDLTGVPAFAATNASMLEKFEPPKGIKKVDIFADNDSSFVGQSSAYSLAKRLASDGVEVEVFLPSKVDTDWLDQLGDKDGS